MSVYDSKFNVPEYVANADPSALDSTKAGAVVVEGLRIDNKAAAWVARSEIMKSASGHFSSSAINKVNEACRLFGLTENDFVEKQADCGAGAMVFDDGIDHVVFNVVDNETLNKAASELVAKRPGLSYLFARECAEALRKTANDLGLSFNHDNLVAIKKIAGHYHVDYSASKSLLDATIRDAESAGMSKYASELRRVSAIFSEDCPEQLAPLVIEAIDQTRKALPLNKQASSSSKQPEQIVYITNSDHLANVNGKCIDIRGAGSVRSDKFIGASAVKIAKWASDCGFTVDVGASPSDIADTINSMPGLLRKEFVEIFG
jgi:hypothetical protein